MNSQSWLYWASSHFRNMLKLLSWAGKSLHPDEHCVHKWLGKFGFYPFRAIKVLIVALRKFRTRIKCLQIPIRAPIKYSTTVRQTSNMAKDDSEWRFNLKCKRRPNWPNPLSLFMSHLICESFQSGNICRLVVEFSTAQLFSKPVQISSQWFKTNWKNLKLLIAPFELVLGGRTHFGSSRTRFKWLRKTTYISCSPSHLSWWFMITRIPRLHTGSARSSNLNYYCKQLLEQSSRHQREQFISCRRNSALNILN